MDRFAAGDPRTVKAETGKWLDSRNYLCISLPAQGTDTDNQLRTIGGVEHYER